VAYIRVTLEALFRVPDDHLLVDHPVEDLPCIQIGDALFMPTTTWVKEGPQGLWSDDSEDVLEFFHLDSETVSIEPADKDPGENGGAPT
jgi:hypothetical protein